LIHVNDLAGARPDGFAEEPAGWPMPQYDWMSIILFTATLAMAGVAIGVLLFAM